MLAAFLALHFLARAHRTLSDSNEILADEFSLSPDGNFPRSHDLKSWWKQKWQPSFGDAIDNSNRVEVDCLWAEYVRFGKRSNTWVRVLCLSVLYALLGSLMITSLGEPIVPYRGPVSKFADIFVLFGSVSLLILLIFNVVDITLGCERFVRNLSERVSRWPTETVATWSNEKWEPGKGLEEWLDIRMIAKRTQVVGALIVGPFVVLFFMILSRISLFDRWDWPISLIIIFGFHSILAISAVILLNRAAKRAKGTSLERLGACRVRLKDDEDEVRKIDILIDEIEKIEQGAFAPLSRQPVLRAFLVPFGGIIFVLWEYLGKIFG
jgi:hypothetical protein